MEVQVQSSTTLGKGNPNPNSKPSVIPFTIFDRFAPSYFVTVLFAFVPPTPPNWKIIEGLEKILVHFPTLTGTLGYTDVNGGRQRPCVLVGGDGGGALVVETMVKSRLEDHLPLEPKPHFELLQPCSNKTGEPQALLQVQLNRFECGGLIISVTNHHHVADGQSMSTFFLVWGKAVRGAPIDPLPNYDLSCLNPRSPLKCEFDHWGSEFLPILPQQYEISFPPSQTKGEPNKIDNIILHFSREFICTSLKARTVGKYTTIETLLAHIWRKITIVRGLKARERTEMRVSVNGRPRLRPGVPREFFGNLVLNAYPDAVVSDLVEGGIEFAAEVVHEAICRVDNSYFKSLIDFGEIYKEEELVSVYDMDTDVLSPNMEGDSWLGFPFLDFDFGGEGALCAFLPSWFAVDGSVVLLPSLHEDGGIDVFVGLFEEHAKILKQTSHVVD